MSFSRFIERIASSSLRQVAQCWREACRDRAMPAWHDIDFSGLAAPVPQIWSCDFERATGRFLDCRWHGASFRIEEELEALTERHRRVVDGPALMYGHGCVFRHLGRFGIGERIALPLAQDGVTPDGIFGATVYDRVFAMASVRAQRDPFEDLRCTFDALDPAPLVSDRLGNIVCACGSNA